MYDLIGFTIQLVGFIVAVAGVFEQQLGMSVMGLIIVGFGLSSTQANIRAEITRINREIKNIKK